MHKYACCGIDVASCAPYLTLMITNASQRDYSLWDVFDALRRLVRSGNLGATVSRLNDNWAAIFQQQSKANKTRLIPVEKGTGYAVIRADDDAKTLCIGHPIVADRRDAVIALSRTSNWSNWNLEIHNPTNKDMKVNVKHNPAFNGFNFNETLTLAPGTSVFRDLGPVEKS